MTRSSGIRTCSMTTSWLLIFLHIGNLVVTSSCNGLSVLLIFVDSPVKDVVILEPFSDKEIAEDLTEVRVIRLVVKAKGTSIVEIDSELVGEPTTKDLSRRGHLLLHNAVVLLLLGGSLESLPRQRAAAEV